MFCLLHVHNSQASTLIHHVRMDRFVSFLEESQNCSFCPFLGLSMFPYLVHGIDDFGMAIGDMVPLTSTQGPIHNARPRHILKQRRPRNNLHPSSKPSRKPRPRSPPLSLQHPSGILATRALQIHPRQHPPNRHPPPLNSPSPNPHTKRPLSNLRVRVLRHE